MTRYFAWGELNYNVHQGGKKFKLFFLESDFAGLILNEELSGGGLSRGTVRGCDKVLKITFEHK